MHELTKSFHVICDNELMFPRSSDGTPNAAASAAEKLDALGSVWEVAKTLVLLPAYLATRIDLVKMEDRATQLGTELRTSLKAKRAVERATPDARVLHRRISAIRVVRASPLLLEGRSYHAPAFQVPVDGFWRTFADPTRQGHDEAGEIVIGRTWVRAHIRHKDKAAPTEPKVVYIKASLSLARQRLERFRKGSASVAKSPFDVSRETSVAPAAAAASVLPTQSALQPPSIPNLTGAYLYVMRCPAHGRDIFKVGFTDRDPEIRARELSSATASPTHFLVVQAWAVSEGMSAERAAHGALERFRLAGNREFFQAQYAELRNELEKAITPWALK